MNFCNVSVVGTETIRQDLETELKNIEIQSNLALSNIGAEMVNTLQKFINEIWYKGYSPKWYKRRTDGAGGGEPLGSAKNMNYVVNNNTLEFDYTPTGKHENPDWNMNRTGDELINWLQKGGWFNEYYAVLPQRPFWSAFLNEMQETLFSDFQRLMSPYSVIRDNSDYYDLSEFDLEEW